MAVILVQRKNTKIFDFSNIFYPFGHNLFTRHVHEFCETVNSSRNQ